MLGVVEKLVEKGYAYEKLRSVYFDISKLDDYGKLSNVDLSKVKSGKTVELDEYEKDSPVDFTLLKRSTLAELKKGIYYKTRWGNVRPSWHLECAALSMKFGDTFDIHASGSDICFPHCENVLAIGKATRGSRRRTTGSIRNSSWSRERKCRARWATSSRWRIWKNRATGEARSDTSCSRRITENR